MDEDWTQVHLRLVGGEAASWLCAVCYAAYKLAVVTARESRSNKV